MIELDVDCLYFSFGVVQKNTGRRLCFVFFGRESPPRARIPTAMGLFPPGLGKFSAPQGPTSCASGAPLIGQYCLLWG